MCSKVHCSSLLRFTLIIASSSEKINACALLLLLHSCICSHMLSEVKACMWHRLTAQALGDRVGFLTPLSPSEFPPRVHLCSYRAEQCVVCGNVCLRVLDPTMHCNKLVSKPCTYNALWCVNMVCSLRSKWVVWLITHPQWTDVGVDVMKQIHN